MFIKEGVLKNFAIFTEKHQRQGLLLISCRPHLFNRTPPGNCFWNMCTCENLKPKLFNLRIPFSLCNFNYLQIFVKAKVTAVKFNSKISIIYHQIKFRKGMMNRLSVKILFLKISQYSHKNSCVKRRLQRSCFPMNIAKFLRTPVLKNICERLFERFAT